jgi:hypothetical protein
VTRENEDACAKIVARVERSETRESLPLAAPSPDFASLNPGYKPRPGMTETVKDLKDRKIVAQTLEQAHELFLQRHLTPPPLV